MTPRQQTTYSRRDLELLLPDYAFGRLSAEEAHRVAEVLQAHPDLAAEAEMLRAIFQRLETTGYMRELERHSSTLSVQVLNRWKSQRQQPSWQRLAWLLLPTLGLLLLLLWWSPPRVPSSDTPATGHVHLVTPPQESGIPYADGLVTFTYWSSGVPPVVPVLPSQPIPQHELEELLNSLPEIEVSDAAEPYAP
ncbi:MAG: hypothetical protein NZ960_05600 [Candidatus Kapabacteria bacterium]|nr:hypothetical protein [Candidatus Kapabacteria bacterium]MDW8012688.1 hypothetical protein [Bacteroidota bacterium]